MKKDHTQTVGDAARAAARSGARGPGRPGQAATYRREQTARRIIEKHGDPLEELARIMAAATDPKLKLDAAKALAPYLYPAMKAVEVSAPGGEQLIVEVRKA
ncbi:hypothetical protein Adeh_1466 [Anaeromyxobacter dehalogenans 2CP-C]|uniref:Uncharacterized protein n=1 Tax=Anaeromyxobacter dehalogenans (strain 2CP-C) TaxID=290397 RepID=Q2IHV8_ANADE|nr:hypothetical protein Adeh_1466 [Anaeromyxobacter dehalogenans 2CP-C]